MKRYLILLVFVLLTACGGIGIQERLDDIDSYVDDDPQAALSALQELDMDGVKSARVKAHYSLLHSKALDKCYIDTTDVAVVIDAVNYYSRHGNPDEKMQAYYYLGRIHGNAGRWSESIIALTNALDAGEESADVKYKGRVYIAMADAYNRNYNVVEEGRCVDEALNYFNASGDSIQIRAAMRRKAISCLNIRDYELADSLFKTLLALPDLRPSLRTKCLYDYAYLMALRDDGDYQRTKSLFEEAIKEGANLTKESVAAYAYILWCCGNESESEAKFKTLEQNDSDVIGLIALWKSKIKEKEGLFEDAYDYLTVVRTSTANDIDNALQQSLSIAQRNYFSSVASHQKERADNHKKISMLIGITSIAVILLLVGVGLNVIRRHKERENQAISNFEFIKERMTITQKESDDKIKTIQTKFLNVFREHFQELAKMYETYDRNLFSGNKGISAYNHIQEIFKAIRGEEESEHRFEKIIDNDMDGLISSFRKDYPDLNELEYLLFCYYVAGYETKTISIILSEKTPDALYMRKSRLKKLIESSAVRDKEKYLQYF